jgi:hypothetical protein
MDELTDLEDIMKSAYEVMQIGESHLLIRESYDDHRWYYLMNLESGKQILLPKNVPDFCASVQYAWDDFEDQYEEDEAAEESDS